MPKEIGFCEPSDSGQPITRFFFDNEQSKKCQAFTFMGCGGNENNFITKHECQAVCQSSIDDQDQEVKNNDFFFTIGFLVRKIRVCEKSQKNSTLNFCAKNV